MKTLVWIVFAGACFGCADKGTEKPSSTGAGGSSGGAGQGGKGARAGSGGSAIAGSSASGRGSAGSAGEAEAGTGGDAGEGPAPGGSGGSSAGEASGGSAGEHGTAVPVPLPPGSREVDGIVNLVDAEAAGALEASVLDTSLKLDFLRDDLVEPLNLFFDHYLEKYDFVFLFTDHWVDGSQFAGVFKAVNRQAVPGGGVDSEVELGGIKTTGRTRAGIVIPYQSGVGPPLAHEVLHFWANHLDPTFGFGVGLSEDVGPHWGYAGVNGSLGGFDPASLRCETPAGALPPGCTPESNGRTRYVVDYFGLNANGFRDAPYGALELYLMGLLPKSEAPGAIEVLAGAETVSTPTSITDPLVIEAAGLASVELDDIIARHGQVGLLPEDERAFAAAFVVISAEPADDAVLAEIAGWAAAFGNRGSSQVISSFEKYTGDRASMNTLLGPRRDQDTPPPPPRERFVCDLLEQDCPRNLACYPYPPNNCVLSDGVELDQPCAAAFACAPGLVCAAGASNPDDYFCKPFCDSTVTSGPKACDTLCPGSYVELTSDGELAAAFCVPS